MLGRLILDTVILIALVVILGRSNRGGSPRVVLVSLGVATAYFVCDLIPGWLLGPMIAVPLVILTGVVLMVFCRLQLKQAALAAGLFLVFRVVLGAIIRWVF